MLLEKHDPTLPNPFDPRISSSSLSFSSHPESHATHLTICEDSTDQYQHTCQATSIDVLPDDALLEIFDFYVGEDPPTKKGILVDAWRTLVHVCKRWRILVFGSPRRLELQLVCRNITPTRKILDVWPAFPLIIQGHTSTFVLDDLIAALERRDRVRKIDLGYRNAPESGEFWAALQEPFPELTHLRLKARRKAGFGDEDWDLDDMLERPEPQDLSNTFLGGSTPRLQYIWMNVVRLPGLQKLFVSATHLVDLHLVDIPEYNTPQQTASCLSVLTNLQRLSLSYQRRLPYQEIRYPSPPKRAVFPDLRYCQFTGTNKYLENLIALVDAPELNELSITFTGRVSNTIELAQIVSHMPKSDVPFEARVVTVIHEGRIAIRVRLPFGHDLLNIGVSSGDILDDPDSEEFDHQLLYLAQVCASLPTISTVENLYIYESFSTALYSVLYGDHESAWLDLLRSFVAVKNLYIFKEYARRIAYVLEDFDEGHITELLPSLKNIFVRGLQPSEHIPNGIGQFIAARRVIGHPIAVSTWDIKTDEAW